MRTVRVYSPAFQAGEVVLSPEESHHVVDSLRAQVGDEVTVFDGAGREGRGQITGIRRGEVSVAVDDVWERRFELRHRVTLAVAMAKAHRQGYLIEKCTELGVHAIWPIMTERGVVRPSEFAVTKWARRAIEAAKQSGRAWIPVIEPLQPLAEVLGRAGGFEIAAIADEAGGSLSIFQVLSGTAEDARVLVCVGPEGGWTNAERRQAADTGLVSISLGPAILRTETAAVTVCAAAAMLSAGQRE